MHCIYIKTGNEFSFSTGFIFYYWKYYGQLRPDHQPYKVEDAWGLNINDHGGYTKHQLYINKKYDHLKTEIMNNTICRLHLYEYKLSLYKAQAYMNEDIVRDMSAQDIDEKLHYGIKAYLAINMEQLLAVILYTDWTINYQHNLVQHSVESKNMSYYHP